MSVIGFSSTTEFGDDAQAVNYGQLEYVPLYLARPFKENNTDTRLSPMALNGQFCLPKSARAQFSIERVFYNAINSTDNNASPVDMARTLPIHYRIIQIGFKANQGTQEVSDPNTDLFLDTFGQPTGIDQPDFSRLDCRYATVNSKKYHKY